MKILNLARVIKPGGKCLTGLEKGASSHHMLDVLRSPIGEERAVQRGGLQRCLLRSSKKKKKRKRGNAANFTYRQKATSGHDFSKAS